MHHKNRYFIELQTSAEPDAPRSRETELRRAQAVHFVEQLGLWLREQELNNKVASLAITALGQVQITCERDIISRLRGDYSFPIAAIRQGASLADSVYRLASL